MPTDRQIQAELDRAHKLRRKDETKRRQKSQERYRLQKEDRLRVPERVEVNGRSVSVQRSTLEAIHEAVYEELSQNAVITSFSRMLGNIIAALETGGSISIRDGTADDG